MFKARFKIPVMLTAIKNWEKLLSYKYVFEFLFSRLVPIINKLNLLIKGAKMENKTR